jgi:hypothetical protein
MIRFMSGSYPTTAIEKNSESRGQRPLRTHP